MTKYRLVDETVLADLQAVIDSHSYNNDWSFQASALKDSMNGDYAIRVMVKYKVEDAYEPGGVRLQRYGLIINGMLNPEWEGTEEQRWQTWLLFLIVYLQCHEVAEFLTFNGERVFDPHADDFIVKTQRRMPGLWRP